MPESNVPSDAAIDLVFCDEEYNVGGNYRSIAVVKGQPGAIPNVGDVVRYYPDPEFRDDGKTVRRREFFYDEHGRLLKVELFVVSGRPEVDG